ncbi:MAG: hypothetical protein Q7U88_08650 [Desulfocapsaceae bacterium]|nr:hypothetical protein [Desulfocapsaceae bacterium]
MVILCRRNGLFLKKSRCVLQGLQVTAVVVISGKYPLQDVTVLDDMMWTIVDD